MSEYPARQNVKESPLKPNRKVERRYYYCGRENRIVQTTSPEAKKQKAAVSREGLSALETVQDDDGGMVKGMCRRRIVSGIDEDM